MSFSQLKKNRSKSLEKLSSKLEQMTSSGYSDPLQEKYWQPTKDDAGNGYAIIRFLPEPEGEDDPFVPIWSHGFQGPGGWYIENSLTTLKQDDPVSALNTKLWNSGVESDKEIARKQKRKLKYHSNILVIKDSAKPENEGKVFLFAYGKKIFDKLNDLMNPSFDDEKAINPFDFWEGADFKLKIRKVDGYPNYDKSEFDDQSALFDGDDEKLEEVYSQLNSLQQLVDPSQFKSYEELEAKLNKVLGNTGNASPKPSSTLADDDDDDMLNVEKSASVAKTKEAKEEKSSEVATETAADDDDEDLEFFKKLAND